MSESGFRGQTGRLLLGSALVYAAAFWVMAVLHELSHALAARALGARPVVYPTSVESTLTGSTPQAVEALVGPVFSLALGLLLLSFQVARPGLGGQGMWRLFLLWLTLFNLYEFAGYLMTAPFFGAGDVRRGLDLLGVPSWLAWVAFGLGLAGWLGLGRLATQLLLEAAGSTQPDSLARLRALGIFTWFAGTVVLLLGQLALTGLPAYAVWVIVGAGSYTCLVLAFLRRTRPRPAAPVGTPAPWACAVLLALVFAVQRIWLTPGLPIGG